MFSGIVEATGDIVEVQRAQDGVRIRVQAPALDVADIRLGDSIAVNGCCLTVVAKDGQCLAFDVSGETLSCTVGIGAPGKVNLEKALRLSDRLGGHLVTGHVDGVGTVHRFEPVGESWLLEIGTPAELARYVARKGSIAVDGVSLTINAVDGTRFAVNLIPHTLGVTTLAGLAPGRGVNLEVDIVARYLERMLVVGAAQEPQAEGGTPG